MIAHIIQFSSFITMRSLVIASLVRVFKGLRMFWYYKKSEISNHFRRLLPLPLAKMPLSLVQGQSSALVP